MGWRVSPLRRKLPAQSDDPLRRGGGRLLIAIDSHEHGDPREKMPRTLDDVEMTGCDGIESARTDRMLPPAPAAVSAVAAIMSRP
jgi:hypothetical protein